MEKQNINDLINKAKSSNQQKAIQKIVPIVTKEIEEVQFSFYIDKGYNFKFRKKRRIQWTVLVLFTRMEMKKNTKLQ